MQTPLNVSQPQSRNWVYAELTVMDGPRRLNPTQVAFDRLYFAEPPRLTSNQVEVIVTNGNSEQRHWATVLPHEADATRIPIELLN